MKTRFLLILPIILILMAPGALLAQDAGQSFLSKAPKVADIIPNAEKDEFVVPACPEKARVKYEINYPGGTGSVISDLILENHAEYLLGSYLEALKGFLGGDWGCQLEGPIELSHKTDFQAASPSPGYLSVLFTEFSDTAGANPDNKITAFNFKPGGLLLALPDLFPDQDASLPKFWAYVYSKSCATSGRSVLPSYYGEDVACKQASPPPGDNFLRSVDSVESLGNLVFTPDGATISLAPLDAFDGASGPYALDIPKADLIAVGANPAIWGGK